MLPLGPRVCVLTSATTAAGPTGPAPAVAGLVAEGCLKPHCDVAGTGRGRGGLDSEGGEDPIPVPADRGPTLHGLRAGDSVMRAWGVEFGPLQDRAPPGVEGPGAFPNGPPGQISSISFKEYVGYTGLCAMGPGRSLILLRLVLEIGPGRSLKGSRYLPAPRPAVAAAGDLVRSWANLARP